LGDKYFICELEFDKSDPRNPDYSMPEVDVYAWIPYNFHQEMRNHRLSLRKNLKSKNFEVYRRFQQTYQGNVNLQGSPMHMISQIDTGLEEVAFKGNFVDALEFMNKEYNKYHKIKNYHTPCEHKWPNKSTSFCGKEK